MGFTIPNAAAAGFSAQAEADAGDVEILSSGHARTGVVSGCAVTAQGSPDMTVAVASGTIAVLGVEAAVSSGNVTITTADATNPRFDLIVSNASGTKSAVAGTAAANPVFPAIPASSVVLAAVYVPANDTAINTNQITDKRVILSARSLLTAPTPTFDTTNGYGVPGFIVTNDNNQTGSRGIEWLYTAMVVKRPITLTKVMKRTVATLSAQIKVRFALYACSTTTLAPTGAPLYDFEVIVANGTVGGVLVTQVLNTTLQPGIYFGAWIHDAGGGYSWSAWLGHSGVGAATNSFGNGVIGCQFVSTTYPASAPTPPLAPTGVLTQTSTFYQWSPA